MDVLQIEDMIICRHLVADEMVQAVSSLCEGMEPDSKAAGMLIAQAERLGLSGNIWQQYLLQRLCDGDNVAAATVERTGTYGAGLVAAVGEDMKILLPFLQAKASALFGYAFLDSYTPAAPRHSECRAALAQALGGSTSPQECARLLLEHYRQYGSGPMAEYMAFRVRSDGGLVGIEEFPHYEWDDLLGYDHQKSRLLANTVNFIEGREANNVLLTGARGTGKSTGVKALVYRYHDQGLRLVQVGRSQLSGLAQLMERLAEIRSRKFILFLDDLSFDEDEKEYKYLKSAIDGGVSPQPPNVLLYATSNRRHLLKETWKDRSDEQDEVYRDDSTNESISLSDRFGLILHYATPTQDEYLQIIDHELRKAGVCLDAHELRIQGLRWEMEHSGRNGRIAQQFVKWYLGNRK
ncbi:ATP-binding protein [uncultured Megasphaera sp.]|uniref:ATP-binding protein n=1 Tax=uncultured Megasphaera sp. TaxID=165188 RepID=UPI002659FF58|nr:ATP-binding protein [uncultured Megasphaera sp.]